MTSLQRLFYKSLKLIIRKGYDLYNSQYYVHPGIDNSVKFCASYPGTVNILCPDKIQIGKNSVINANSLIDSAGNINIGKYCHFGSGLVIYSSSHDYRSDEAIPYGPKDKKLYVNIGDFVWMGSNVTVLPGVTVGEGCVIAMGSVVNTDCPELSIVAGNPAKVIGYRDNELFYSLKKAKKFI